MSVIQITPEMISAALNAAERYRAAAETGEVSDPDEGCEMHYALEAALAASPAQALYEALGLIRQFGELANVGVEPPHFYSGGKKPASKDVWQFPRHLLVQIDAALSKARGDANTIPQSDAARLE